MERTACGRCGQPFYAAPAGYAVDPFSPSRADPRAVRLVLAVLAICLAFVGYALVVALRVPGGSRGEAGSGLVLSMAPSTGAGSGLTGAAVDSRQIENRLLSASAVTGGDLEVSLAWNTLSDLDLSLRDPYGELIWAKHRQSQSGGVQDVDANPTLLTMEGIQQAEAGQVPGRETLLPLPDFLVDPPADIAPLFSSGGSVFSFGASDSRVPSRWTRSPVEHIYFAHAPKGTYTVFAHCYSWREPNHSPLPYTVEIRTRNKAFSHVSSTIGPASYVGDGAGAVQVCQFTVR